MPILYRQREKTEPPLTAQERAEFMLSKGYSREIKGICKQKSQVTDRMARSSWRNKIRVLKIWLGCLVDRSISIEIHRRSLMTRP